MRCKVTGSHSAQVEIQGGEATQTTATLAPLTEDGKLHKDIRIQITGIDLDAQPGFEGIQSGALLDVTLATELTAKSAPKKK